MAAGVATHAPSTRGRGRPRASLACINCRSRKVKCDVQALPVGATCTPCHSSSTKCIVNRGDDRRKVHARDNLERLQGRLEKLEALVRRSDAAPAMGTKRTSPTPITTNLNKRVAAGVDDEDLTMDQYSGEGRSATPQGGDQRRTSQYDMGKATTTEDTIPHSTEDAPDGQILSKNAESEGHYLVFDFAQYSSAGSATVIECEIEKLPLLAQTDSATTLAPITPNEDSVACLDVDQTCGQPRYYGPASRLYIHESGNTPQTSVDAEMGYDSAVDLDSPQIQKRLLFLFWQVQVMPAAVVDQDLYCSSRAAGGRSQYYSEFLQDCLLACASRHSTSSTLRGLGELYIDRAKKQVASELEHPTLASLQGFLLLSDFEATQGRDRVGWIYCGTACRLLYDLGLQEDCSDLVKRGRLTTKDASMRQNCFLVTFVFEKFWSLYLGRPSSVNEAALAAVLTSTKEMAVSPAVEAYVTLCVQISSVTDFLNSAALITSSTERMDLARSLDGQLEGWYGSLPASLKDQGLNSSEMEIGAYGINMQFCGIRIVLHRMLSRLDSSRHGTFSPGMQEKAESNLRSSHHIIHDSAVEIVALVRTYKQIYGVDLMAPIMLDNIYIAAQALIQHITWLESRSLSSATDLRSLRALADTMKDVETHYPITARMRSTLARLVDGSVSIGGMFGHPIRRQPDLTTPSLLDDFTLAPGAWGSVDTFFNFDFTDSSDTNLGAMFETD